MKTLSKEIKRKSVPDFDKIDINIEELEKKDYKVSISLIKRILKKILFVATIISVIFLIIFLLIFKLRRKNIKIKKNFSCETGFILINGKCIINYNVF